MPAPPTNPSALDMLTTDPPSRMRGSTYFIPRNTPRMLTAMTRSKSSSGNSTMGRTGGLDARVVDEAVDLAREREGAGGVAEDLFGIGDVGDVGFQVAWACGLRS